MAISMIANAPASNSLLDNLVADQCIDKFSDLWNIATKLKRYYMGPEGSGPREPKARNLKFPS